MAEMTEEEKYARKSALLKRAIAQAEEMDKKDEAKAASVKAKEQAAKAIQKRSRVAEKEAAQKKADQDATPVLG